jgi:hypothetical protein
MTDLGPNDNPDALAQAIHQDYRVKAAVQVDSTKNNPSLLPWDALSEDLKAANRSQAGHIPVKLQAIGCELVPASERHPKFAFADAEIERLGQMEHSRWCADRRRHGWSWGSPRDDARKLHPNLVAWEQLSESDREKDRDAVRRIPALAGLAGFQIVRGAVQRAR